MSETDRGSDAHARTARRAEAAYGAVYGGVFLSLGALIAFWPVWLASRGLSEAAIGWLTALAVGARIVAGLVAPALADGFGAARVTMTALALGGAVVAAAHLPLGDPAALAVATVLLAVAYGGFVPLAEADGYSAAERIGFSYQRARSVGSAGFLSATLCVGALVTAFGVDVVIVFVAAALMLAAAGAWATPSKASGPPRSPGVGGVRAALAGVFETLRAPRLAVGFAAAAAIQASHAVYHTYGSLHWTAAGFAPTTIGLLWSLGVAAEIVFFLTIARGVIRRLGPRRALVLAGAVTAARWAAMTLDPGLGWLLLLQCTHAISFGATHLALMAFIAADAPPGAAATAQGAAAAIMGAALLLATAAATALYPSLGASAYGLGTVLGLAGAAAALAMRRPGSRAPRP